MLLRVISDIHGNIQALEAVLDDPPGAEADETVCLGDVVGYGARPSRCISRVRRECTTVVRGNHDTGVAGLMELDFFNSAGREAVVWTRERMSADETDWLGSLPLTAEMDDLFLCHSNPHAPDTWGYVLYSHMALAACRDHPGQICLIGHTHLPLCWNEYGEPSQREEGSLDDVCIVNAGSVGQPRDENPRAAYLLLDTDRGTWSHRRVRYDVSAAASDIREAGLPETLWRRLSRGR
ncbi:MAG: metallophosphoesterase family protein [Candidatus Fermentibacteraceae bacterium]